MRRLIALLLPALFLAAGGAMSTTPAAGQVDVDALRKGLIYDGLQRVSQSDACRGNFRLTDLTFDGVPLCTHGPDPAPAGIDVREVRQPPAPSLTAPDGSGTGSGNGTAAATQVPCIGNGSDGDRVQLIYARASTHADNYASWLPSFQQWAARIDDVFNASAAETGGTRHVRFVEDSNCVAVVNNVVLSPTGLDNFDNMASELRNLGYTRTDRKYIVWADANVYCGIAQVYYDDSPGQGNASNGNSGVPGEIGRIDNGCWGLTNMTEAHELTHTLGAVQQSAPHSTPGSHCTDDYDRMCYSDGTGTAVIVCADPAHENRLDCNHDDYYTTAAAPGSYLDTHWNVANSAFLTGSNGSGGSPPPPSTTTTTTTLPWWLTIRTTTTTAPPPPPSTTTTTRPPSTTTTTAPPPSTTTTTAPPPPSTTTTTAPPPPTTAPPNATAPSAPQSLFATQPSGGGHGVLIFWSPPASPGSPPFTTYRIYRGTTSTNLAPLVDIGPGSTSYIDSATTSGAIYWYAVRAVNTAGQSPSSNITRMVAR